MLNLIKKIIQNYFFSKLFALISAYFIEYVLVINLVILCLMERIPYALAL